MCHIITKYTNNGCAIYLAFIVIIWTANRVTSFESTIIDADGLIERLSRANNEFSINIFNTLSTEFGNEIISPLSLFSAFGILYNSANGTTSKELSQFLHLEQNKLNFKDANEGFRLLFTLLARDADKPYKKYTLSVLNNVIAQTELDPKQAFIDICENTFKTKVLIDPLEDTEALKLAVNAWVNKNTQGKIERIIDGKLASDTQFMILNAVYFKGLWEREFPVDDTREGEFTTAAGVKQRVKMMSLSGAQLNYIMAPKVLDAQLLELCYIDRALSFVILLPTQRDGLRKLKRALTPAYLSAALSQMSERTVNLLLPKFRFEESYALKSALMDVDGLSGAFSASADYRRLTDVPNVSLNDIVHKVMVEVTERGTEASAATSITMTGRSGPAKPAANVIDFRCDRPFAYLIRDMRTGMIVFMGQVTGFPGKSPAGSPGGKKPGTQQRLLKPEYNDRQSPGVRDRPTPGAEQPEMSDQDRLDKLMVNKLASQLIQDSGPDHGGHEHGESHDDMTDDMNKRRYKVGEYSGAYNHDRFYD